ncbi:hypothetical protein L3X39_11050 [Sabulilitoribacter multivorans]|uniref:Lipoprotein n=1 Tax=Flaviramulus multivorans TaxID=1304750 RepID=A0ABS9IKP8_9FLAO|nr:hypothetical protein [Flaviramulus multivorans]MCF7561175.1 hypothetical protein [Flaviramulus multivorans]
MSQLVNLKNTLSILILILVISCVSQQKVVTEKPEVEATPKLIFINYLIKNNLNDDKTKSVRCINTIITDGALKKNNNKYLEEGNSGDLNCRQLDKNSNVLQSVIIKNPLVKTFEYVDESNEFRLKTVELDSVEFSLKLKLEPNAAYITISEFSNVENNEKQLIKTPLKL